MAGVYILVFNLGRITCMHALIHAAAPRQYGGAGLIVRPGLYAMDALVHLNVYSPRMTYEWYYSVPNYFS